MSKVSSASKIKLNSFDDLFGENTNGEIREIPISSLYDFKNHPFKVLMDEEMDALVESIKLHGKVLQPVLARLRAEGEYELISGHRRKFAANLAGLTTIPAIIREMTDEQATIIMVDSNLAREKLLFSEKAFAYKMKFEAMTKPGSKMDKQVVDKIGEEASESGRNIQRYIRLTYLMQELLDMVDEKKIPFIAAVELSYLPAEDQKMLYDVLAQGLGINGAQAVQIRKYSQTGELNTGMIELILAKDKEKPRSFSMKPDKLDKYFPKDYSSEKIEEIIFELLEQWKSQN